MSLLTLLSASGAVVPVTPGQAWTLTVGGDDLTTYVHNGARFVEFASSTEGLCAFTLNGVHTEAVAGASILLSINGHASWEGTVSTATVQNDADGNPVGMMVLGAPLSAQLDTAINYVSTQATDVSDLASALCAQTPVPFGSQTNVGTTGGTLSIKNAASGLSVAGLLTRKHWRVQNGSVSYVGPESMTSLSQSLSGASVSASSISVTGGLDATTKQPLQGTFTATAGPAYHASHPEIADHATLTLAGSALAERYSQAMTTTLSLPVQTNLRAGDWFVDPDGVTAHAHRVEYALTGGKFVPTVDFGFPALPVASADTQAARAAQHPASSVAHDFLVSGAAFSSLGLSVTIGTTTFVLGGTQYTLNGASLTLQPLATQLITATSAGFSVSEYQGLPAPGSALPLFIVTTGLSSVIGHETVAPHGGIGSYHLKPANPNNTPSVSAGSITLTAEGATSAKASIPFSISGLTLDDTIGSIEIVQSFAGLNQWGNSHVLAWSPAVTSFTDERHGLAAGQGYDIAVNILGRDGKPLNASPLIIGTSPTISAAAIAIALNLDQVQDGITYLRMPGANMDGNRRGLIDFTQVGHVGKILDNIGDGSTYFRMPVSNMDGNRRALIDFAQSGHIAKIIDNIQDGTTYARIKASEIQGGSGGAGTVKQLNDGTYTRTASNVAAIVDETGKVPASTALIAKIPNSAAWTSDVVLHWSSSGTSPNITMTFWYDNGSGGDSTIYNPDGTTINIGHTTSTTYWKQVAGISTGNNVYVLMYWLSGMQGSVSTSSPSQTAINQAYADGGYVAFNATAQPASAITPGGSGSKTGGGINQHNNF